MDDLFGASSAGAEIRFDHDDDGIVELRTRPTLNPTCTLDECKYEQASDMGDWQRHENEVANKAPLPSQE